MRNEVVSSCFHCSSLLCFWTYRNMFYKKRVQRLSVRLIDTEYFHFLDIFRDAKTINLWDWMTERCLSISKKVSDQQKAADQQTSHWSAKGCWSANKVADQQTSLLINKQVCWLTNKLLICKKLVICKKVINLPIGSNWSDLPPLILII